ncbi:klebsazolicin family translation inhibitor TOMM [Citrobacter sp. wls708]|nr:klebsazolicin family translation inhibitor TOMM [Citrobacter sp. wls708]
MSKIKNRFGSQLASFNSPVKKGLYSQSPGNCASCSNSSSANCTGGLG